MPIPQVNDRIKEAPAVMLRAVFAGVGQLLLAADKIRARAAETGWPPVRTATLGQTRAQSRWHTLDGTRSDTVPLARERTNSHHHPAQRPSVPDPGRATAGPAAATAGPAAAAAGPAAATEEPRLPTDTPPLPGYDDLSLPSLRAKMRVLDAATLRAMLDYEKGHAHRDDVISMFERRLTKIASE